MSLHGTISVNLNDIGWWQAKRISGGSNPDDVNTYDVSVHTGRVGERMTDWRGTVQHRYGDGALALAVKALAAALAGPGPTPEPDCAECGVGEATKNCVHGCRPGPTDDERPATEAQR